MKKSKIILPAIALLAISGAASVTGTVAWFTAANSTKFTIRSMSAVNVDSTLKVDLQESPKRNVTIDNTNKIVSPMGVLTNASFDLDAQKTYLANEVTDPATGVALPAAGYREVATTGIAGVTADSAKNTIYYSYSWTAKFTCPASSASPYDLFFDLGSTVTSTGDKNLAPAFRIAIKSDEDTKGLIWNPEMADTTVSSCKYVKDGAQADYSASTSNYDVVTSGAKATTAMAKTTAQNRKSYGYLGTLSSTNEDITVTFTVWCEGEDGACVNAKAGGNIAADFQFYAINQAEYQG